MEFHEFGNHKSQSIMLIHGLGTTWDKSYGEIIPQLSDTYHVIAVGLDGHISSETTDYINGDIEAEQVQTFIQKNLNGRIDVILGSSLGCVTTLLVANGGQVTVKHIILDGTADLSLGFLTKPVSKLAGWFGEKVLNGQMNWFLKLGGITPDMLEKLIYKNISRKTLENAFVDGTSLFSRVKTMKPNHIVKLSCWYGSREKPSIKGARKIRKAFPLGEDIVFEGYGHGEILLHPKEFSDALNRVMKG